MCNPFILATLDCPCGKGDFKALTDCPVLRWIADTLVSRGSSVTTFRKIMQTIGFLGPAFFLTQLSHVDSPAMAVFCMACNQGVLLGLSNTAGVLAGVFGTAATGYILQHGSWDDVFKISVGLYLVGTFVWNIFSTGEKILD
ncbi:hypothetical protein SLEP1_g55744 [Rubroshorea leprosula]|uniref:Uncharacterized protein n=1 Tax=Rubroshorea leprosula TaxID=152421 RepID=A0AAV5MGG1_9ROSI|nr:hypothetical protein SLEP1_g55744 [Rubroshorea leprosula]